MNILWVTNIPLPEASLLMNEKPLPYGGWLINAASSITNDNHIKLNVAFPIQGNNSKLFEGKQIDYYTFPSIQNHNPQCLLENPFLLNIINKTNPDLVHIFGTEFMHTLAVINICKVKNINIVISIQGLVSFIAKHYTNGLPVKVQRMFTFRDFIKRDNIILQQQKFTKRGKFEVKALQMANHAIGRTTWDKACLSIINPQCTYHHCNEVLRDEFYKKEWNKEYCDHYSIFVSQGSYPIKGVHFILEAMPLILKRFAKTKLYIGGPNITKMESLIEKMKISSYGKYIKQILKRLNIEDKVIFTGELEEKEMCHRYLKSHVFVCSSTIENSPNSLGEAMILGVPSIASNVGGVSDMLEHKEEGFLYPADEPYMLAHYICGIFESDKLADYVSKNARVKALRLYDKEKNNNRLLKIYTDILEESMKSTVS